MDKESIYRLGLDYIKNIDLEASDEIYNPGNNNHIIILKLLKDKLLSCPYCGIVSIFPVRSSCSQLIKHASSIENNLIIKLKRRIYICGCGHTFKEENPFTSSKRKTTLQKELKILDCLKNINKSFSDVAQEFNLSVTTIQTIFDSRIDIRRQTLTEVLCVDEVYSKHCGYHKYCFITYSPQLDRILDVLPSRKKEELCGYFGKIPLEERKRVKFFSMDLYDVYRQIAKLCFPNALICADHFHVIKNITDYFNSARIRVMKKYEHLKDQNDNWYWLYKKYWKLLLKAPDRLGYKKFRVSRSGMYLNEHEITYYMLSIDPNLKEGYELLNEYRNFNSVASIDNASSLLDELIVKFHNSTLEEFYKTYKLLKNWRQEIINSFTRINNHVISNGGMERTNRDIKTIIRQAYGFTNFSRLRNRIMYVKNDNVPIIGNIK